MANSPESSDESTFLITHSTGAEATVSLHGGHVISWKTADGTERLFLSELAEIEKGKAIRGGVPVIFPQFSDHGPFGRHGFARKSEWNRVGDSNRVQLKPTPESLAEWPHEFELELEIELSATELRMTLNVTNTGTDDFQFHAALHTYLQTADATAAAVDGLQGLTFQNEVTKSIETDNAPVIAFSTEIDRAYFGAGETTAALTDAKHVIEASSDNFPDIIVWNPGPDHGIGDLTPDGWKSFVCIEGAQMHEYETLAPGRTWTASQSLKAIS